MTLLSVEDAVVEYGRGRRRKEVVHGISLEIEPGETLGLVGESGSGKTTIGRAILGLIPITAGRVTVAGREVRAQMTRRERQELARDVQVIFQDPYTSLNPSLRIVDTLSEPLVAQGVSRTEARSRVATLLDKVNLPPDVGDRLPREFSGGQRQRIAIARALALEPKLIVCDEPVSALDLTTQEVILELLIELQERTGVGYLFISHDLSVVRHISHRVAVMLRGNIIEQGDTRKITEKPTEEYTRRLLLASPVADPRQQAVRRSEWLAVRQPTVA
jgi:ABC-type glutathione transport system ATPase component